MQTITINEVATQDNGSADNPKQVIERKGLDADAINKFDRAIEAVANWHEDMIALTFSEIDAVCTNGTGAAFRLGFDLQQAGGDTSIPEMFDAYPDLVIYFLDGVVAARAKKLTHHN